MKNKHVGYLVLGLTLVFFFVVMSFNYALQSIVEVSCTHGTLCPMHATVQTQQIISYGLMGLLALVSLFIIFFMKDETIIQESKKEISEEEKQKKLEHLDDEERGMMNIIIREDGSVFQSSIVKETKLSKVKVTRILDRLEGKSLIERKRRGMSNVVILK
ncbi:MarR family transcriptional regulator [Candidatus Woesearchaeota archaeon]|jgi:uncharacterized membrane protein|nr:MarR family transcriptional regulator [Candidatus Woesearchaeota archaeon]MBT4110424.1 MarR family transcriptional regulator [Candidatus Woesearchaeota archaeon]MBT4336052.1 MarR family transcriptional regulator [Candidatus Woesearchaeota archaeon]MBT4468969.1 MarR family transcriptional regulator [Candidatus Woesearchaeota archaeon]MBT6744712.1 MarR family transcriptional regulator [Candidatus Woesearchaeota archaeon]